MATSRQRHPIRDVEELDDLLSEPTEDVTRALASLEGDVLILGVGGKMGPTLARMARRASDAAGSSRRVIGVSRFSSPTLSPQLQSWGVETLSCDLMNREALADLPDASNVIFMAGMKFGSTGQESLTWAMNSFLPGMVSERFPTSRIAVFSTGNVYGLSPVSGGGSVEADTPNPVAEYAMSCLGRERVFEHFSRANGTEDVHSPVELLDGARYGVLVDVAQRVCAGHGSLSMGYLNAIWRGDACHEPAVSRLRRRPVVMNIAGPELLSVRRVAERFGECLHKPVRFEGRNQKTPC